MYGPPFDLRPTTLAFFLAENKIRVYPGGAFGDEGGGGGGGVGGDDDDGRKVRYVESKRDIFLGDRLQSRVWGGERGGGGGSGKGGGSGSGAAPRDKKAGRDITVASASGVGVGMAGDARVPLSVSTSALCRNMSETGGRDSIPPRGRGGGRMGVTQPGRLHGIGPMGGWGGSRSRSRSRSKSTTSRKSRNAVPLHMVVRLPTDREVMGDRAGRARTRAGTRRPHARDTAGEISLVLDVTLDGDRGWDSPTRAGEGGGGCSSESSSSLSSSVSSSSSSTGRSKGDEAGEDEFRILRISR